MRRAIHNFNFTQNKIFSLFSHIKSQNPQRFAEKTLTQGRIKTNEIYTQSKAE